MLKPDESLIVDVVTSLAAIKVCGFKDPSHGIMALVSAYELEPEKVAQDPVKKQTVGRAVARINAEIKENKSAFCERAWRMHGPYGTASNLLTRPPVRVGDWTVAPIIAARKFSQCQAGRDGLPIGKEVILRTGEGSFLHIESELLKLEIGKIYPVSLESGSVKRDVQSIRIAKKDLLPVKLTGDLLDLLRRSDMLKVRVADQVLSFSFRGGSEVIEKLEACYQENSRQAAG